VTLSPDGAEGTFSACSFWYVEALTHPALISAAFNLDRARGAVITRIW
jgi:hypothetical protein